jgi:hypothetical protein
MVTQWPQCPCSAFSGSPSVVQWFNSLSNRSAVSASIAAPMGAKGGFEPLR